MVIYHYPKELSSEAAVGSALRPVRMCEAFRAIGEEVIEVTGSGPDRIKRARGLEKRLADDAVLYSESVNLPPAITWLRRRPWRMNFDYRFLGKMHSLGVPTGLFYRDIYWVLEENKAVNLRSFIKKRLTPAFARRELRHYEHSLDVLFLPHKNMGEFVPFPFPRTEMRTLPPGGELRTLDEPRPRDPAGGLKLLYVGNIAPPHYDIRPYIRAVEETSCACLKVVTRGRALTNFGHLYDFGRYDRVELSEAHGEGLVPLYEEADVAVSVRDDSEYLAFAMPVKIFEAISFGVPLIVSAGLRVVAEMIERDGLGWVISSPAEFQQLLARLAQNPRELADARQRVHEAREHHTWEARAREVVEVLRRVRTRKRGA
jgi:glycosyltransferase involved in cell wall biosynthesis